MRNARTALALVVVAGSSIAQTTILSSVSSSGGQANAGNGTPTVSNGGRYVAFESNATNLTVNDTTSTTDIFRHDRSSGATVLVSATPGGVAGAASSTEPDITPDGRYVAFTSVANNLVLGDAANADVFVRDVTTGTTTLVSRNSSGVIGNHDSFHCAISDDARYVAFGSSADNLVAGDTNGFNDVFVRDRTLGTTVRVSVDSFGAQANGDSAIELGRDVAISGNGRWVAFTSRASNLVPSDTNGTVDVFVHDMQTGTTVCASVYPSLIPGGVSFDPSISADGHYVAFSSGATLAPTDTNGGGGNVFVRDMQLGVTVEADLTNSGVQVGGFSNRSSISNDGRYVAFRTSCVLVPSDANAYDIYVRDLLTGCTFLESVSSSGASAQGDCDGPALSPDGEWVAFSSLGSQLVIGDNNGVSDVFEHDMGPRPNWFPFCFGDGLGSPCPCANHSYPGNGEGCDSSLGYGGKLKATGTANFVTDSFVLIGSQMPNSTALYFQADNQLNLGLGYLFGDGLLCAGGSTIRLGHKTNSNGMSQYPDTGDLPISARGQITSSVTRYYQIWYRNSAAFCQPETYNLTNAIGVTWGPCFICP